MTTEGVLRLHTDGFNRALLHRDYAALEAVRSVICSFGRTVPF